MESVKMLTLACIVVITCWHSIQAVSLEPEFTKYQFIEQVIERMVRMSDKMDEFVKKMDNYQNTMDQWKDKMEAINGTVTQTLYDIEANNREFKSNLTATNKEFSDKMTAWRENTQLVLNDSFVAFNESMSIALTNIRMDNREFKSNLTTVNNNAHQKMTEWRNKSEKELNDAVVLLKEKTHERFVEIEAENREFKSNLTAANNDAHQKNTEWRTKSEKELNDTVIGIKAKTNERLVGMEADYREFKSNLTTVNKAFQTEIGACRGTADVAFNVYSYSDQSLTSSQPVVFDEVRLNTCGDCYSTTTGVFTAPVGGIYQFNAQLCTTKSYDLDYKIMVGSEMVLQGEFRVPSNSIDPDCVSFSAVYDVDKGQPVSVRGYGVPLDADDDAELRFSGVLIKPR